MDIARVRGRVDYFGVLAAVIVAAMFILYFAFVRSRDQTPSIWPLLVLFACCAACVYGAIVAMPYRHPVLWTAAFLLLVYGLLLFIPFAPLIPASVLAWFAGIRSGHPEPSLGQHPAA